MKLTKAQLRVLRQMAQASATVIVMDGRAFFSWKINRLGARKRSVQARTVWALAKRGLVANITPPQLRRWRDSEYQITDAGREAIK